MSRLRHDGHVGELTFLPAVGAAPFSPGSCDRYLGDLVDGAGGRPRWSFRERARLHRP